MLKWNAMGKRAIKQAGPPQSARGRKDLSLEHLAEPQPDPVEFFVQVTAEQHQQLEELAVELNKPVAAVVHGMLGELPAPAPSDWRKTPTAELVPLSFKVAPAFKKRYQRAALDAGLRLNELLFAMLERHEAEVRKSKEKS
jgi:hypothetical protein